MRLRFASIALLASAPPLFAQVQVPLQIPPGTHVPVTLLSEVTSKTAKKGEHFKCEVDSDIVVDSQVVIPKGAIAVGTVADVEAAGRFGNAGKLIITVDSVMAVDSQYVWLTTSSLVVRAAAEKKKNGLAANASSVVSNTVGNVVGNVMNSVTNAIPGGSLVTGLFRHGDDIVYKAHTKFSVSTAYAFVRTPPKPASDSARPLGVSPAAVALFEAAHSWDMALGALAARHGSATVREFGRRVAHDDSLLREQERALAKATNTPTPAMSDSDKVKLDQLVNDLGKSKGEKFDQAILRQMYDFEQGFTDGIDDDTSTVMGQLLTQASTLWNGHAFEAAQLLHPSQSSH